MLTSALSSSLFAMNRASGDLQQAAKRTAEGDLLGGTVQAIEAKAAHRAAVDVTKSEDERLQELVDLL